MHRQLAKTEAPTKQTHTTRRKNRNSCTRTHSHFGHFNTRARDTNKRDVNRKMCSTWHFGSASLTVSLMHRLCLCCYCVSALFSRSLCCINNKSEVQQFIMEEHDKLLFYAICLPANAFCHSLKQNSLYLQSQTHTHTAQTGDESMDCQPSTKQRWIKIWYFVVLCYHGSQADLEIFIKMLRLISATLNPT